MHVEKASGEEAIIDYGWMTKRECSYGLDGGVDSLDSLDFD